MVLDKDIALLNAPQKEAVLHFGSPLLILAGPGSGKTRVITIKISFLINVMHEAPYSILAMTFTNKAAREMQERLVNISPPSDNNQQTTKPFISTFHSCGAYLLRRYAEESGLQRNFQIYDAADQISLLQEANPKIQKKYLKGIMRGISKAKDYGLTYQSSEDELSAFMEEETIEIYKNYELLKKNTGNVDFGDLLIMPYKLLKSNEKVYNNIKRIWKWFFIDEYQDTNTIQSMWLHVLCKNTGNITVVGDDDQSIYRFRGAIIENILSFENNFSQTKIIHLGQNYRSTPEIVNMANEIIAKNTGRYAKQVFSKETAGSKPKIYCFNNEYTEAEHIVSEAKQAIEKKEQMAIFYRINAFSRGYEMALRKANIPYELVGAVGFFERAEVKDAVALIKVYKNSADIINFRRIANKPARGIGAASLKMVLDIMKQANGWIDAWRRVSNTLSKKAQDGFLFLETLFQIKIDNTLDNRESTEVPVLSPSSRATASASDDSDTASVPDNSEVILIGNIIQTLLERSGLWAYYEEEDNNHQTERIDNLKEFISYAMDFHDTEQEWNRFFEQVSLNEGLQTQSQDAIHMPHPLEAPPQYPVQLITLHRSKGLEFDRVVICGLEDGLIPMIGADVSMNEEDEEIEEERRLFYVGITRAKKHLSITYAQTRRKYGRLEETMPSMFLEDFDRNLAEWIVPQLKNQSSTYDKNTEWAVGKRVMHTIYGKGTIKKVGHNGTLEIVHIEFDNDYEASFISKFTQELSVIKNE